ncbi:hypothetical protein EZS27_034272 [termite gut metagenome]|uniref:Uncharacterized protein n=1 Tax=termite gut metagenome TaxID=433724 RepID=A0A5J4Q2G7_9ZZZZ
MTIFICESLITDKLTKTIFTKIVLFAGGFLTVFLYFCTLAIEAMKAYCDLTYIKIIVYNLIVKTLISILCKARLQN